jgi:hypothetical protein
MQEVWPVVTGGESMSQYVSGQIPDISQWQDYNMAGYGEGTQIEDPDDWRLYGLRNYGAFAEQMGILSTEGLGGIAVEAPQELLDGQLVARTPLLELEPGDYEWMKVMKRPYDGMAALGDDGSIYEYDDLNGFFSRIWKGAKKIGRRIKRGIKKIIKKIPGGKYLIRLGKKVWKIAKKYVKPLLKYVGKYAKYVAPVAAFIPGFGPAVAAGLYTAGKVAKIMSKVGAVYKKGKKLSKIAFPSGKKAKKFKKLLKQAARKESRRQDRGGKVKRIGGAGKRRRGRSRSSGFIRDMIKKAKRSRGRRSSRRGSMSRVRRSFSRSARR